MIILNNKTIGERLKECRKAKKENQEDLAKLLNVQRQIISYYETGARTPNIEDLAILAKHFDTTVDYLIGLSEIVDSPVVCQCSECGEPIRDGEERLKFKHGIYCMDCARKAKGTARSETNGKEF